MKTPKNLKVKLRDPIWLSIDSWSMLLPPSWKIVVLKRIRDGATLSVRIRKPSAKA